tara:strand:+ start:2951 stop:4393 length:1443 start_codon:yes stop_codon:yes gene_type:complete
MSLKTFLIVCLLVASGGWRAWAEQDQKDGVERTGAQARHTPLVELIERCLPAVASLQTVQKQDAAGVFTMGVGSASLIHEEGYLLTNNHVLFRMHEGQAFLPGHPPMLFRIIATMSSEDLALVKVDAGKSLPFLKFGRSHDLMLGEPVVVIGNPGGLVHSVSEGIVSGLNRSTAVAGTFLPGMVQTSAAVSGGNSGGPLINALGEQIGVITSKKLDGENINFAITADRVRELFPTLLSAELRYGFRLGLEVEMLMPSVVVGAVNEGSPAEIAGIEIGDVIEAVDGREVNDGVDFHLALVGKAPRGRLDLKIQRNGEQKNIEVELGESDLPEPIAEEGVESGLKFEGFEGSWDVLPNFDELDPVVDGVVMMPTEEAFSTEDRENYGIQFEGFVKIPEEGLYTFYTSSDDGSRLSIGNAVVVNNDGLHAVQRKSGLVRLPAGLHPVTVSFFEQAGDEELAISWEGPGFALELVPEDAWFHMP